MEAQQTQQQPQASVAHVQQQQQSNMQLPPTVQQLQQPVQQPPVMHSMNDQEMQQRVALIVTAVRSRNGCLRVEDDPTMKLSREERARALQVKQAMEADHRLAKLTDFEYVQYALAAEGETMEQICQRAFMVQCFKDEYKLTDTIEEGIRLFDQFTLQQPGVMLAMEYLPTSENYVGISDYAAFRPEHIQTDDQRRLFLGMCYYKYHCLNPNFRAIRNGVTLMVECMDMTMANLDARLMETLMVELFMYYPKKVMEWFFLNSDTTANMTYALWKRFLPERTRKSFQLGHQIPGFEGQRIDLLYNVPTPEKARERMLLKVLEMLYMRYQNQRDFSLKTSGDNDAN